MNRIEIRFNLFGGNIRIWLLSGNHVLRVVNVFPIARLCSVGYAQTIPGAFTPGITLQRTSVSAEGHSYPYPELVEVLNDIHTLYPELVEVLYARGNNTRGTGTACFVPAQNFCEFCTPVPQ